MKELGGAKRREVLTSLTEEQHLDIDIFLMHFPDVRIHTPGRDTHTHIPQHTVSSDALSL